MLSTSRRNLFFRISIVANVALLLFGAMHLSGRNSNNQLIEWDTIRVESSDSSIRSIIVAAPDHVRNFTNDSYKTQDEIKVDPTTRKAIPTLSAKEMKIQEQIYGSYNASTTSEDDKKVKDSSTVDMIYDMETRDENVLTEKTLATLKVSLDCKDKDFLPGIQQRGEFWVLSNYIRAEHGPISCHESITYTTHAGFEFLDNVLPLVARWIAPVSLAIHAPGSDFEHAINSIRYLRDCIESDLVRAYVTFHLFFSRHHMPKQIPKADDLLATSYNCSLTPDYHLTKTTYTQSKGLLYPVNVARNIARDAALTHYVLPSDIELYPSPSLVPKFLNMVARNEPPLNTSNNPRVFPISIFEVKADSKVPETKTALQEMLKSKKAIPFHKYVCPNCHNIPEGVQWMKANETNLMGVFHVGKRSGKFSHWEPIFIGTATEPHYDERLSWQGKQDKMTQGYTLCVLNYDFMILNNAFLVHRPGIKTYKKDTQREHIAAKQNSLIKNTIFPELKKLYGTRPGCVI